jgi:hypothetical protein
LNSLDDVEKEMAIETLGFDPSADDPRAPVTAPLKPRPHTGSAAVALPAPEEPENL